MHKFNSQLKNPTHSRDIINFIRLQSSSPDQDSAIGDLLVKAFTETYALKLPDIVAPAGRIQELRNVAARRQAGVVVILELGYRIIGSFSLIKPGEVVSESFRRNSANLRCFAIDPEFQGLGFAEILLAESERLARIWNCDGICLHVQNGAFGVERLYKKRGYARAPKSDLISYGFKVDAYYLTLNQPQIESVALEL